MHMHTNFSYLSQIPLVFELKDLLSPSEISETLKLLSDRHWLAQKNINVRIDVTGISFELPLSAIECLDKIHMHLKQTFGIKATANSIRIRDYRPADQHGLHHDHYRIDGTNLLFTSLLYLTTTEIGGETNFPHANQGKGLSIAPEENKIVMWVNYDAKGNENMLTEHESLPVQKGRKLVAIFLFYGDTAEIAQFEQSLQQRGLKNKESK